MSKKELTIKDDAYNRILQYMNHPDKVTLQSADEKILDRWITCNTMLRDRKLREEDIIDRIVGKFGVSKFTARNDIGYAMSLFVQARTHAKEYLLRNVVEDLGITLQAWKMDKSLAPFVPKLYHEYVLAITKLPDDIRKKETPAVINNFYLVPGQNIETTMSYDDAIAAADEIIEQENKDFHEFEDVKDDNSD